MRKLRAIYISLLITIMATCFILLVAILGYLTIREIVGDDNYLSREDFQALSNMAISEAEKNAASSMEKYCNEHGITIKDNDSSTRYLMKETMYAYANSYGVNFHREKLADNTILDDESYNAYKATLNKEYDSFSASWDYFENHASFDDSCTDSDKSYFIYCASLIPINLLSRMVNDGWTFELVREIITDRKYDNAAYHTEGCTFWKNKTIQVDKDSDVRGTLLHEVGHVLAKAYGLESICVSSGIDSYDDNALYNTFNHFHPNGELYIYWNYDEALADFFAEYICYPKELKRSSYELYSCYEKALLSL